MNHQIMPSPTLTTQLFPERMKTILSFLFFILFAFEVLHAQEQVRAAQPANDDTVFILDSIIIVGNTHTKDYVIQAEISLHQGVQFTPALLEYEQNRIYSLGLFNRVQIHILPKQEKKADLVIEVHERWYIFPFPVIGIRDRDWNKLYYGAGLLHSNFRGRNEKLFGMVVLGYDPAVEVSYRTPYLSLDGGYLGEVRFAYQKVHNRSVTAIDSTNNFNERHINGTLSIGKRFDTKQTVWLTIGFESVDVSEYQNGRTIASSGKDQYPFLGASYTLDSRDLIEYPSTGTFIKFSVKKYGFPSNNLDFVRYATDIRKYIPLVSNFTLTGRLFSDIVAAGITPTYNRVYLGYSERIRGHFKEVREGENLFGLSTELHYPFFQPVYVKLDFLPTEFSILRFGIVAAAFADAGTVWFRHHPFALDTFTKGYGCGIHFLLPYSMILRTDYAWNESRQGEFILDLGTSF
jgi:outer membrane protein assembly factor BamA